MILNRDTAQPLSDSVEHILLRHPNSKVSSLIPVFQSFRIALHLRNTATSRCLEVCGVVFCVVRPRVWILGNLEHNSPYGYFLWPDILIQLYCHDYNHLRLEMDFQYLLLRLMVIMIHEQCSNCYYQQSLSLMPSRGFTEEREGSLSEKYANRYRKLTGRAACTQ
jgi:hypothetical protein